MGPLSATVFVATIFLPFAEGGLTEDGGDESLKERRKERGEEKRRERYLS